MTTKRWNGSSYVDLTTFKRWNGSAWVSLTFGRRWNGSAWIDFLSSGGAITFSTSDGSFIDSSTCDTGDGSCPITYNASDTDTYTIGGTTGAYTLSATVSSGDSVTIDTTAVGQITVSTSLGRNSSKSGEIKVTITDTLGSSDFYVPFAFSYTYLRDSLPPPFNPEYPPPELQ
jgi:hypothetical protein